MAGAVGPSLFHDAVAMVTIAGCAWALLSPRVPTGILGSAGLGCIIVACLSSLDVWGNPLQMLRLMSAGVLLGLIQVAINRRREARLLRRLQLESPPVKAVREPASCERTEDRRAA